MVRVLAHQKVTADGAAPPARWLLFLHGVYGAGRNWASLARRLVRRRRDWGAVLVDLREHGGSRGFPPPHTLPAAAGDVAALVAAERLRAAAVLGHSFGGKVALHLLTLGLPGLERVWVVDSTPEAGPPRGSAWEMLEVVRSLSGPFPARQAAVEQLVARGIAAPVAEWMSTNLEPSDRGYRWRLDLETLEALLRDFFRTDLWRVVEEPPPGVRIHFIKAEASGVLSAVACGRLERAGERSGQVFLHRLAGGHWLNADNPEGVLKLLETHL
ncbi:MAG: alpha/beta hydrolase [Gemmatimonadetes bacterium]|nr:alpha/beta hydrolase [Gemmatimonadota bacterium]